MILSHGLIELELFMQDLPDVNLKLDCRTVIMSRL